MERKGLGTIDGNLVKTGSEERERGCVGKEKDWYERIKVSGRDVEERKGLGIIEGNVVKRGSEERGRGGVGKEIDRCKKIK